MIFLKSYVHDFFHTDAQCDQYKTKMKAVCTVWIDCNKQCIVKYSSE